MAASPAREAPRGGQIAPVHRIYPSGRESRDCGGNDLVVRSVAEGSGQRAPVERVVDRTAQPRLTEERSSCVEGDVVDERRRIEEELLMPGPGRAAARPVSLVEHPTRGEQRGRVVEILREEIGRSPVRERDRRRGRDVFRVDDARWPTGTAAVIVGISQEHRTIARCRRQVVRACGRDRTRRGRIRVYRYR